MSNGKFHTFGLIGILVIKIKETVLSFKKCAKFYKKNVYSMSNLKKKSFKILTENLVFFEDLRFIIFKMSELIKIWLIRIEPLLIIIAPIYQIFNFVRLIYRQVLLKENLMKFSPRVFSCNLFFRNFLP